MAVASARLNGGAREEQREKRVRGRNGVRPMARRVRALVGHGSHDQRDPHPGASRQTRAFATGVARVSQ